MRAAFDKVQTQFKLTRGRGSKRCRAVMLSRCAIVPVIVIVNAFLAKRYPVPQAHAQALTSNGLYCYARF